MGIICVKHANLVPLPCYGTKHVDEGVTPSFFVMAHAHEYAGNVTKKGYGHKPGRIEISMS